MSKSKYQPRAYPDVFDMAGPYQRIKAENPGLSSTETVKIYKEYLRSLGLVDPTPVNDIVGWIARRITGQHKLDCIVVVYGDRGVGKSLVCGYLGERLDKRLCMIDGLPPKSHFSIDNVRSVDKSGTLAMLSPDRLKERENQVFVLDDASIATNARSFQSPENQYLNFVLTTARIYRHCIIINTIAADLIDSVARSFADVGILVEGIIPGTTINQCRIYHMGRSNHMGFGRKAKESIGKFHLVTIAKEPTRMTRWYTNKPTDEFTTSYDILRKVNTDNLGGDLKDWMDSDGGSIARGGTSKEKRHHEILQQYDAVMGMMKKTDAKGKPLSTRAICRETGLTSHGFDVIMAEAKRRGDR